VKRFAATVQGMLRRFGYTIRRYDQHEANHRLAHIDTTPYGLRIFAPWNEAEFNEGVYARIQDHTLVSPDRCYLLDRLARHATNLIGEFAECGVYRGGTAYLLANAIRSCSPGKKLHLFDTFEGMPETAGKQTDGHIKGDFGDVNLQEVQHYLSQFDHICYHVGNIPWTFQNVRASKFCFVHIDVDIYRSTFDSLSFFYPRLVQGGVLVIDDYGFLQYRYAAKKAVDDFMSDKRELVISLPTGQCVILKL
jgi:O-methyltransferase